MSDRSTPTEGASSAAYRRRAKTLVAPVESETSVEDREAQELVAHVGDLLQQLESLTDAHARSTAEEALRAVLDLYGEALAHVVDLLRRCGSGDALQSLVDDELVSHLLLVHGLHPVPVETRVASALDEVRPYLRSHGGNVEFLGIRDGNARVRLQGSCDGCPSSTMTLKLAIEQAISKHAPDLDGVEAEGAAVQHAGSSPITFVPRANHSSPEQPAWAVAGALPQLASDRLLVRDVAGEQVLFARLGEQYYAYWDRCPHCHGSLVNATLRGGELTCPTCEYTYDIQRAGRCLGTPSMHIEPIPLLVTEAGLIKIALRTAVG